MAYIAPRSLEVSGRVSLGFRLAIDVPIAVRVYYRKMRPNTGPKYWRTILAPVMSTTESNSCAVYSFGIRTQRHSLSTHSFTMSRDVLIEQRLPSVVWTSSYHTTRVIQREPYSCWKFDLDLDLDLRTWLRQRVKVILKNYCPYTQIGTHTADLNTHAHL